MSSETITRNDLTAILNTVLPFSFTEFRHHTGTITVPNSTLVQVHSETFESGSWFILTSLEVTSGGAVSTTGQNRIVENGMLIYSHKDIADNSLNNTNYYVLKNASNTTITLESFQATGNSQTQAWSYTAIRIGDKFAQPEADYIVEQGTDGIWTYRKWNSGIAECWGTYTATLTNYTSILGGYAYYTAVSFPSGLFLSKPVVTYTVLIENNFALTGMLTASSLSKDGCNVYAVSNASGSHPTEWRIDVKGRWK